jgi:uncharacterized protein (TIGR02300 family)
MAFAPARVRRIADQGGAGNAQTGNETQMAKTELGTKRICVACGTRFYDLAKTPAICPKCGTEQPPDQPRPRRAGGNVVEEKRVKKPVPATEDADLEVEGVEAEAEEDVLEDASDLEEDAELGTEIEVETDADETER